MRQPTVRSTKQHIRLWFEFYKLAFADPALGANLSKVRIFYEPWGNPTDVSFDDWWRTRRHLFGATKVEEIDKAQKAPNVLNVAIPLNMPISRVLPEIKAMIEEKQRLRMEQLGLNPKNSKSLKTGFGSYEINAKELRGRPLHEALLLYQVWLEMGKPTINSDFLNAVRDRLLDRPKAKWLPSFLLVPGWDIDSKGNPCFTENQIRQMRRSIKKAQDTCEAVSRGKFPA